MPTDEFRTDVPRGSAFAPGERAILHCDLNNFYASVECLYRPELRDRPVAVCGNPEKRHGIVLAKNQLAKRCGIRTGEAIWQARSKCPGLVLVVPDFSKYLAFSRMARAIYEDYTDAIEPFGIDECWLDVTGSVRLMGGAEAIAERIRNRVRTEMGVTVSVGVSWNKVFAKLGSDMKKPDAPTVISRENYKEKVWPLPVGDLLFVGRSTASRLHGIGIDSIGRLARLEPAFLRGYLGKWGEYLWFFANGHDASPVERAGVEMPVKGVGNSMTTPKDIVTEEDAHIVFQALSESVAERLRAHGMRGRTVQIHIRDTGLVSFERQLQLPAPTCLSTEICGAAVRLLRENWQPGCTLRSLGVRVTALTLPGTPLQLSFLEGEAARGRMENLEDTIDDIRKRFGHYSVQRALMLKDRLLNANPVEENIIYPCARYSST
jgi:DNA polymerase-4